jgi:hypothetical protein
MQTTASAPRTIFLPRQQKGTPPVFQSPDKPGGKWLLPGIVTDKSVRQELAIDL